MIVEFIGPPGSGKSTLYRGIAETFHGRMISANEVNNFRLRFMGVPLRTGIRRNDKNIQRLLKLSSLYRKSGSGARLLIEKGVYNLLYVMHVRGQGLRVRLAFYLAKEPTHLIVLLRPGTRRTQLDTDKEEAYGYDKKVNGFYDTFIKAHKKQGMNVLVLDAYATVAEDLEKVRRFLDQAPEEA